MTATLSLLIPSAGRSSLARALDSALHQLAPGDEIVVCGDVTDGPLDTTEAWCLDAGLQVRYVPHSPGYHDWGHSQVQHGMTRACGDYLTFLDDDDRSCPGAFAAMRQAIADLPQPGPLLFRFVANFGRVVWQRPYVIGKGLVGGHCLCAPNLPSLLGTWGPGYEGDYDFVAGTIALWGRAGVAPVWIDRIIARQRDR